QSVTHNMTFTQYIKQKAVIGTFLYAGDRYKALNFENADTIEFRLFRGTTKFSTVMATLEFVNALYFYAKQSSWQQLTVEDFLAWVNDVKQEKFTRYLRPYIVERDAGDATTTAHKPTKVSSANTASDETPKKKEKRAKAPRVIYGRFAPDRVAA
ncbi:amidoligase family protein, partial [Pelistega indica]|uniref:amidoligase family protein n=1 Tax=Pelistega indica TaxID=1414851 RepID=UPI00056CA5A8